MQERNLRSIAYLTVSGAAPLEQIEAAAESGLDAVGLRVVAPLGLSLAYPIAGNAARIREIRNACQQTGVRVLDSEVFTLTPQTDINAWIPALAAAAEIGSTYMQITSEDPDWSRGVANFARVCDEANRFGLKLALEFMRWRSVRTIQDAARLVTEAQRPNGGIVLDTLHLSRSHGAPEDVVKVPATQLMYVQLCDAVENKPTTNEGLLSEARGGRLNPGAGSLWLEELFDVLPDDIPISIEVPGAAPADASVRQRTESAKRALDDWLWRYRRKRPSILIDPREANETALRSPRRGPVRS
jgi:sugar phosphate isomerase/epimerase